MEQSDSTVQEAIKELRARLGLNQVDFSRLISRAINTVSRYESQVTPKGEALIPYAALAIRSDYQDLAKILGSAIVSDFGNDFVTIIDWLLPQSEQSTKPEDDVRIEAFRAFITAKNLTPIEAIARKSLEEMLAYYNPKRVSKKSKKTG